MAAVKVKQAIEQNRLVYVYFVLWTENNQAVFLFTKINNIYFEKTPYVIPCKGHSSPSIFATFSFFPTKQCFPLQSWSGSYSRFNLIWDSTDVRCSFAHPKSDRMLTFQNPESKNKKRKYLKRLIFYLFCQIQTFYILSFLLFDSVSLHLSWLPHSFLLFDSV